LFTLLHELRLVKYCPQQRCCDLKRAARESRPSHGLDRLHAALEAYGRRPDSTINKQDWASVGRAILYDFLNAGLANLKPT